MGINGETCGYCNKGKLHQIKDEVEEGIFVVAYKCDKCNEIAYSENVMRKVEAMQRGNAERRSLIKIGSSLAISIPIEIVRRLKLKPKEKVYVTTRGNQIVTWITPS